VSKKSDEGRAFDAAMRQIARLALSGLAAADGSPLAPKLDGLAERLRAGRATLDAKGAVDPAWLRDTIRDAAVWLPDEGLPVLAALGRIARKLKAES
jgi:hypothetical protein